MNFWIPDNLREKEEQEPVTRYNPNSAEEVTPIDREDKKLDLLKSIDRHLAKIEKITNTIYDIIYISIVVAVVCLFFDLFFGWMQ